MSRSIRSRRTAEQWQALIAEQAQCGFASAGRRRAGCEKIVKSLFSGRALMMQKTCGPKRNPKRRLHPGLSPERRRELARHVNYVGSPRRKPEPIMVIRWRPTIRWPMQSTGNGPGGTRNER